MKLKIVFIIKILKIINNMTIIFFHNEILNDK